MAIRKRSQKSIRPGPTTLDIIIKQLGRWSKRRGPKSETRTRQLIEILNLHKRLPSRELIPVVKELEKILQNSVTNTDLIQAVIEKLRLGIA